jgi:ketosteroid isomerase-like protein
MRREDMLAKVDAAYQARRTGDFAALEAVVSPEAVFSYGGEQSLLASIPASRAGSVRQAAQELYETIEIRKLERVTAVAEDNRVAILWNVTLIAPGSEPFDSQMFDLWEFNDSGLICKGTQFLDTAKIVQEIALKH